MLLIVGTVRLPADRVVEALPAMEAMVMGSRAEDGCDHYSYAQDVLDAGLIHVKELWRDRDALDLHAKSDHMKTWRAAGAALGIAERNLRLYAVGEPSMI